MSTFLSTLKSASPFLSTFFSAVIIFEFFFLVLFFHFGETQTFMREMVSHGDRIDEDGGLCINQSSSLYLGLSIPHHMSG